MIFTKYNTKKKKKVAETIVYTKHISVTIEHEL